MLTHHLVVYILMQCVLNPFADALRLLQILMELAKQVSILLNL